MSALLLIYFQQEKTAYQETKNGSARNCQKHYGKTTELLVIRTYGMFMRLYILKEFSPTAAPIPGIPSARPTAVVPAADCCLLGMMRVHMAQAAYGLPRGAGPELI